MHGIQARNCKDGRRRQIHSAIAPPPPRVRIFLISNHFCVLLQDNKENEAGVDHSFKSSMSVNYDSILSRTYW